MKKIFFVLIVAAAAAMSCSKINELDDRVGKLEKRMDAVETAISQINTNIAGLQSIVSALSQKDYIREVKDIKDASNNVIGYEIVFDKKGSVKIYHGAKGDTGSTGPQGPQGQPGSTPQIGIALDTDGQYYWTLNGSWLLDSTNGQKVLAVGQKGEQGNPGSTGQNGANGSDGNDGLTPQLRIEQGQWELSYDGQTWTQLGVATSVNTDNFFTSVAKSGDDLVLTLHNGDVYRIPIGSQLSIAYNVDSLVVVQPGETRTIHYVISTSVGRADIEVLTNGDVKAKLVNQSGLEGDIQVICGTEIDEYCKVVVLVTDGVKIITDRFEFETEGMTITDNSRKPFEAAAGDLEIEFLTNTEFDVVIPAAAQSWISCVATKAMAVHGMTLRIAENTGVKRSAVVSVKSRISNLQLDYTIVQEGLLGVVRFVYTGAGYSDSFPTVSGTTAGATVDWGDAVVTAWGTYTHNYTDGQTSHTITVTMGQMTEIGFGNLKGISSIDVSEM